MSAIELQGSTKNSGGEEQASAHPSAGREYRRKKCVSGAVWWGNQAGMLNLKGAFATGSEERWGLFPGGVAQRNATTSRHASGIRVPLLTVGTRGDLNDNSTGNVTKATWVGGMLVRQKKDLVKSSQLRGSKAVMPPYRVGRS